MFFKVEKRKDSQAIITFSETEKDRCLFDVIRLTKDS